MDAFKADPEKRERIEIETGEQSGGSTWLEIRKCKITASCAILL